MSCSWWVQWAGGLDSFAAGAQVGQDCVDAVLVDGTDGLGRDAQANPAVFALNPEPARLQVGQETTLGLVVGVGNVVAHHGAFSGHLAYACHGCTFFVRAGCRWGRST